MPEDKKPLISNQLVDHLSENFSPRILLYESKNLEGLEQLGFLKGALFIVDYLCSIHAQQNRKDL